MHILFFLLLMNINPGSPPPGTVKLSETLYIDRSEVTNVDWREMLYWYKKHHGDTSSVYMQLLPDSTRWRIPDVSYEEYFRHPRFQNHPVVCVSYEQVLVYCKWRSDRVNEAMYRKLNKINVQEPLDYSKHTIPAYVSYRLPTPGEWEKAAAAGNSGSVFMSPLPGAAREKKENSRTLLHISGNVSEMTSEKGVAKGCNYTMKEQEYNPAQNISYDKPQTWLGFRCICETVE